MHSQTYILSGKGLMEPVSEFVRQYHQVAHESRYPGGFIRLYEDYSFFMGNDLMICIRVDTTEEKNGKVLIEFIAGGGSETPYLRNLWTRNKSRIRHFRERLEEFCEKKDLITLKINDLK